MQITKRDSNLAYGKKATQTEKDLVAAGLASNGFCLLINGTGKVQFTPNKDGRTLSCKAQAYTGIAYGTEIEVEIVE